jgi:CubicO group peptidase (beta-lactamase class C family)
LSVPQILLGWGWLLLVWWPLAARGNAVDFTTLDQVVERELADQRCPGAAIAIVHRDRLIYSKGYGLANVDTAQPVTSDMLFRTGSITKMITAAGLSILAEDGELDFHTPISQYVSELQPELRALTLHQLLTHTAGLADPNAMVGPHDDEALAEKIRELDGSYFFDRPETIYSYSNVGYWTAGRVLEARSGIPFAEFLDRRLFEPLAMRRSTFRPTEAMTWPLAVGHGPEGTAPPVVIRPLADNAAAWPAGQLFSTAPEFANFCNAFMQALTGKAAPPLSERMAARMAAPHVEIPHEGRHYGYGLSVSREGERTWLTHNGSRTGYGSLVRMCPQERFATIVLCNKTGVSLPPVVDEAIRLVLGTSAAVPSALKAEAIPPEEWKNYLGQYRNGKNWIELKVEDQQLIDGSGRLIQRLDEHHLLARSRPGLPARTLTAVAEANGQLTHLLWKSRAYKRTPPPAAAPLPLKARD